MIFKRLFPLFKPYRTQLVFGLIFILITNSFQALGPWVMRAAVNALEDLASTELLWKYGSYILLVAIGAGFFRFLIRRTVINVSRHVEHDLRWKLFRHFLQLEPAFYDRSRIGDLMTRSTSDMEAVRQVFGPALMYSTNTVFGMTIALSLMVLINPILTLLVVFITPLVAALVFFIGKRVHAASTESQEAFSTMSATVQENLSGIRVIKAFQQESSQVEQFNTDSEVYFEKSFRLSILRGIFMPSIMLSMTLAIAGILLLGGYFVINQTIRIGDFVAFIGYLGMLAWPMISIGWVVGLFQRGSASLKRILEILDREPEIGIQEKPDEQRKCSGDIAFEDVSLTYPESSFPALKNVSFRLEEGKSIGIVGRIGCGKSTIISALARLYPYDSGKITLGGKPITDWHVDQLRSCLGIVPQDPVLFSTSIRENITLGMTYAEDEIQEALEISRLIQDLDDFPEGLNTEVGERGITLSGGQKQRVSIARAVIRKPPILVFDDALSAVDSDTEEQIVKNLKKYLSGRSAIIISHRLSSVRSADEILVLDDGEIIERGIHSQLLENKGAYSDLFRKQEMARELEESK